MMKLKANRGKSTGGSVGVPSPAQISKIKSLTGFDISACGISPMKCQSLILEAQADIDIEPELIRLNAVRVKKNKRIQKAISIAEKLGLDF